MLKPKWKKKKKIKQRLRKWRNSGNRRYGKRRLVAISTTFELVLPATATASTATATITAVTMVVAPVVVFFERKNAFMQTQNAPCQGKRFWYCWTQIRHNN